MLAWAESLQRELNVNYDLFSAEKMSESDHIHRKIVTELHYYNLKRFYASIGHTRGFQDNKSCLYCLSGFAVHILECRHVLCDACARSSGRYKSETLIEITTCPLCVAQRRYSGPSTIKVIPPYMGARVLSLDGLVARSVAPSSCVSMG